MHPHYQDYRVPEICCKQPVILSCVRFLKHQNDKGLLHPDTIQLFHEARA